MKNETKKLNGTKRIILTFTEDEFKDLPDFSDATKLLTSNISHFSEDYKSVRHNFEDTESSVYEGWLGTIGKLRFYIWLYEHEYKKGKTELKRKNVNKGFFPENLEVVEKRKPKEKVHAKSKHNGNSKKKQAVEVIPISNNQKDFLLLEDKKLKIQLLFNMLENVLLNEQFNLNLNQLQEAVNK